MKYGDGSRSFILQESVGGWAELMCNMLALTGKKVASGFQIISHRKPCERRSGKGCTAQGKAADSPISSQTKAVCLAFIRQSCHLQHK